MADEYNPRDIRLDVGDTKATPFAIKPIEIVITIAAVTPGSEDEPEVSPYATAICAAGPDTPVFILGREWRIVDRHLGTHAVEVTLRAFAGGLS
jgi:hypothetical protein